MGQGNREAEARESVQGVRQRFSAETLLAETVQRTMPPAGLCSTAASRNGVLLRGMMKESAKKNVDLLNDFDWNSEGSLTCDIRARTRPLPVSNWTFGP